MEIEAKISAINSKQYYNLGMEKHRAEDFDDNTSEHGSEDVDTVVHRYDPPVQTYDNNAPKKSIADEIKEDCAKKRPEPPPDILVSSNCRRKIWPEVNLDFEEDYWDMEPSEAPIEVQLEDIKEQVATVDVVVRNQPSTSASGNFYRNSRRMVVHQVQGIDVRPSCGNCCILQ